MPNSASPTGRWHVWIDRGGTFTDCVAIDPIGRVRILKLLSENPEHYADAPLEALRRLLAETAPTAGPDASTDAAAIADIRMGTTVATNALLTHTGEPTALVITRGFADLPEIGDQARPDLFALTIEKPKPLPIATVEFSGRVTADGEPLDAADWDALTRDLMQAYAKGARAVAISLLHADRHPAHERRIREIAQSVGFAHVSLGSEVSVLPRLLGRTDTAIVDAYLTPVIRRYVRGFRDGMTAAGIGRECRIRFMQSSGGLVDADAFAGKDAILSGPAGGVVGMARVAELAGFAKAIGWDMGGTSTDVSHLDRSPEALALEAGGGFDRVDETDIAGVRVRADSLNIVTVAAGGGSMLKFEFGRLIVGPDSAGANPGPACYRRGGPLTVTDANLLLGRLRPDHFPNIFGPAANESLDADTVRERFAALLAQMQADAGPDAATVPKTVEELAAGYVRVANENMAKPIKRLSVERGRNIRDYGLISFGGAGAQHACAIARMLGIKRIAVHPLAAVLSAYGLGHAPVQRILERAVSADLADDSTLANARAFAAELAEMGRQAVRDEGIDDSRIESRIAVKLRYQGTDTRLSVACGGEIPAAATLRESLAALHRQRFGFVPEKAAVLVDAVTVEIIGQSAPPPEPEIGADGGNRPLAPTDAPERGQVYFDGEWHSTPIFPRESLRPGDWLSGPALIVEPHSTVVVEPNFTATLDRHGILKLEAVASANTKAITDAQSLTAADPVLLEVFHNRFMSIAEQMGASLQKTARSTNIKERLDFSCAVFDSSGGLVANAPHIPVHLGAMGEAVKAIAEKRRGKLRPGDAIATNDPAEGGSHLPDITVITPVFADDENYQPIGRYAALLGHSPLMRALVRTLDETVAADPAPVLVNGPAGSGKKTIVKLLHQNTAARANAPFVVVNCADVPAEKFSDVLLGTVTGMAATSRISKDGAFADAGAGTLVFENVHALPLGTQEILARVLAAGTWERPGTSQSQPIAARILASTDRDLASRIQRGKFRDDLFYLLAGIIVTIPPLAGRPDDIKTMAEAFFAEEFREARRSTLPLSPTALDILQRFDWPGNIRQLRTAVSVIAARTPPTAERVSSRYIPEEIRHSRSLDAGVRAEDLGPSYADPLFFVASRGHHADVGGKTPGSMPPFSRKLSHEGVVFHNFMLTRNGKFRESSVRERLTDAKYPARNPDDNLADLQAQLAANETGVRELHRLIGEFGLRTVRAYMTFVQRNAADAVRRVLADLPAEHLAFADHLDDGSRIAVTVQLSSDRKRAKIDFSGTAAQVPGNLNAPMAVTMAAVLYVFRLLVRRPIPLNSGCLQPLEISIPRGSLLWPGDQAAVSGGNVETSQRVVDVLLGAFGVAGASQGTMNNFTFGNERYQYYETIAGGAGATEAASGASGVHTHMTNTRITDPETLERRFPVRLRRFAIRRGSGGAGDHAGGDGVIRVFEFLEPMHVALLSERRAVAPYGQAGGRPGERGNATLIRADGNELPLPGKFAIEVAAGDRIMLATPGGGGFAPPAVDE